MQSEYQAPASRTAAIEDSYPYAEAAGRPKIKTNRTECAPSELFRYRVVKRSVEVVLVLISAPLTLLVIGLVSVLVIRSSSGPIFYSHRRIRKNGAFFSMWKFRTMCVNSAEVLEEYLARHPEARREWNKTQKLQHDPRITPIGAFLRRYGLDELPQLWNVLKGQMSLVGPRPIVAAEVEKYGGSFNCYRRVKPGLTGLWRIAGGDELSYEQRVALDCDYVERWSLARDAVILLKSLHLA